MANVLARASVRKPVLNEETQETEMRSSFATRQDDERADVELRTWDATFHAWIEADGTVGAEVFDNRTGMSVRVPFYNGDRLLNVNQIAAWLTGRDYTPGEVAQKPDSRIRRTGTVREIGA